MPAATLDRRLRAFDTASGRELWSTPLPAGAKATPMTYRGADGRQYVVIAAGGDGDVFGKSDQLLTSPVVRDELPPRGASAHVYRAGGASCSRIAWAAVMRAGMGKFLFASNTMPILRAGTNAT